MMKIVEMFWSLVTIVCVARDCLWTCLWLLLLFKLFLSFVLIFSLFFIVSFLLCWSIFVLRSEISTTLSLGSSLNFIQVLILMKIYCIFWFECFFSVSFLQARPCMYLHYWDWSQTIFTCRINLQILWSFIESAKVHQKILHLIDHSDRWPKWNFEAIFVVTWCQKVLLTFLPATVSPVMSGISF